MAELLNSCLRPAACFEDPRIRAGALPQGTTWPLCGPWQPPASPGFHPSILTKTQLRNASTQAAGHSTRPDMARPLRRSRAHPATQREEERSRVGAGTAPRPPPLSMAQSRVAGEAAGQGRATAGHVTEEKDPEAGREDSRVTRGWAESAGRLRGRKEIESQKGQTERAQKRKVSCT